MTIAKPILYYTYYDSSESEVPARSAEMEHDLGRRLLLHGLRHVCNIRLTASGLESELCHNKMGKPFLPAGYPLFSISHCPGMVVCALCDSPVGVDAEQIRPFRDNLLRKVLTEAEKSDYSRLAKASPNNLPELFFRYWTLKESFIKYTGEGLSRPLTDISFSFPASYALSLSAGTDLRRDPSGTEMDSSMFGDLIRPCSDHSDLLFFQKKTETGHILSLCMKRPDSLQEASLEWKPVLHEVPIDSL